MAILTSLPAFLQNQKEQVIELQRALTSIKALAPENGGQGEAERAAFILAWLRNLEIEDIRVLDAPDSRVNTGLRPNLIASLPGRSDRSLCIFGHMDTVPPGDPCMWKQDPFVVRQEGDLLYGRGVEDNQQAIVSMLLLAHALKIHNITPVCGLRLIFMADEENGSKYGLDWLLQNHPDLFPQQDLYVVPDGGSPEGNLIEIGEKGQLWLKFVTDGLQCHASTPGKGKNALVAASDLILRLQELNKYFRLTDPAFIPPCSTFTPTRHDQNVEAVNILPGRDSFYLDCRLLPGLAADTVLDKARDECARVAERHDVRITIETVQQEPATCTAPDAQVVTSLKKAIRTICSIEAATCGIGGATVASFLRQRGLEAAVWATIFNTCHQPDECSSIAATCRDAAVFAQMLLDPSNG